MSEAKIRQQRSTRQPHFPTRDMFQPEELTRIPFRSRVSRPLAAALVTLAAGGVGAGNLNIRSSPNATTMLAGGIGPPPGPTIVELIEPAAAEALITRVFADAGHTLREENIPLNGGIVADRHDSESAVGFVLLGREDFSSERVWAHFLEQTMGPYRHIADDPRGNGLFRNPPLTSEQREELNRALRLVGRLATIPTGLPDSNLLVLDPSDLVVTTGNVTLPYTIPPTGPPVAHATIEQRAAALRRLEQQVIEYIEFLHSQGI